MSSEVSSGQSRSAPTRVSKNVKGLDRKVSDTEGSLMEEYRYRGYCIKIRHWPFNAGKSYDFPLEAGQAGMYSLKSSG